MDGVHRLVSSTSQSVGDPPDESEEDVEEDSRPSFCSRVIGMIQLIAAAVLYAYVFFKVVFTLVVPASINPLLYHVVNSDGNRPNDGNVSEGEEKRPLI